MNERTDWDRYYLNTPSYTSVTRKISERKIIGLIQQLAPSAPIAICELGGANSCFVEGLTQEIDTSRYHVVDLNDLGLSLLSQKKTRGTLTFERADILAPPSSDDLFDVVYSVGLVEHFDEAGTRKAISAHFARCRPGGLVLITFPTPTLPYRLIRSVAEMSGKWAFPDERPLRSEEVLSAANGHRLVHKSINWWIGLTQGYLAFHTSKKQR